MDGAFIFQGGEIRFRAVKAGITSVRRIAGLQKGRISQAAVQIVAISTTSGLRTVAKNEGLERLECLSNMAASVGSRG